MEGHSNIDLESIELIVVKSLRGIYFLYNGTTLVYIGQAINLHQRINEHIRTKTKEFDSYRFIEINGNIDLDRLEEEFIKKYRPIHNVRFNSNRKQSKRKIDKKEIFQNIIN